MYEISHLSMRGQSSHFPDHGGHFGSSSLALCTYGHMPFLCHVLLDLLPCHRTPLKHGKRAVLELLHPLLGDPDRYRTPVVFLLRQSEKFKKKADAIETQAGEKNRDLNRISLTLSNRHSLVLVYSLILSLWTLQSAHLPPLSLVLHSS